MLLGPTAFTTIGTGLVTDLNARLETTSGGAPQRASMVPAAVAWDACDCGLLAVSVMRQYLTSDFPSEEGQGRNARITGKCRSGSIVGRFIVQIIRCAPMPDYLTPPVSALVASSAEVLEDAWHVLTGTACYLEELMEGDDILDYQIQGQDFLGPQGGCVGSELVAVVEIPAGGPSVETS